MYFVMKSFWKLATRGGSALLAHSVGVAVSNAPADDATRTVMSEAWRFASAPRSATRPRWYMYWAPGPASVSRSLLPPRAASPPSGVMPPVLLGLFCPCCVRLLRLYTCDVPFGLV